MVDEIDRLPDAPLWKIQVQTARGWADLKTVELFPSEDAAEDEISAMGLALDYDEEGIRVVTADTPQECDLYESEDDFDLVDEIDNLPGYSIQRIISFMDEEGEVYETDPQEPVKLVLNDFDREIGVDILDQAVAYLLNDGAEETSASFYHPGVWYVSGTRQLNNNSLEQSTWHLKGFSEEEEAKIFEYFHRAR